MLLNEINVHKLIRLACFAQWMVIHRALSVDHLGSRVLIQALRAGLLANKEFQRQVSGKPCIWPGLGHAWSKGLEISALHFYKLDAPTQHLAKAPTKLENCPAHITILSCPVTLSPATAWESLMSFRSLHLQNMSSTCVVLPPLLSVTLCSSLFWENVFTTAISIIFFKVHRILFIHCS